jgi:hypothetical protein
MVVTGWSRHLDRARAAGPQPAKARSARLSPEARRHPAGRHAEPYAAWVLISVLVGATALGSAGGTPESDATR